MPSGEYHRALKALGLQSLKPLQKQVTDHILSGQNALVLMPTGWGKSLCYQVPALLQEGLTLVVSPLIALMKDQTSRLKQKQIPAEALHSNMSKPQRQGILNRLKRDQYRLLYVTPERLAQPHFMALLKRKKIPLLAVDEAHCISQWGQDFRLEYSRLAEVRSSLGRPVTLALTATATPRTRGDILQSLHLPGDTKIFKTTVARPHLSLRVQEVVGTEGKTARLWDVMRTHKKGIVYFSLIRTLREVASRLNAQSRKGKGHPSCQESFFVTYHSELPPSVRSRNGQAFLEGKVGIVLATPAFGLGVDKPDIRFVTHFETPLSVEAYWQEVGRAGRDGQKAFCHLLYDEDDLSIGMDFIRWANPSLSFIQGVYEILKNKPDQVAEEGVGFLRRQMNFYNSRDFRVEAALKQLSHWGFVSHPTPFHRFFEISPQTPPWPDPSTLQQKRKHQLHLLYEMLRYIKTPTCRSHHILKYFGEKPPTPSCGLCDNCRSLKN